MGYYDHDAIWESKRNQRLRPLWGSYSVFLYRQIMALIEVQQLARANENYLLDVGCGAGQFGVELEGTPWTYTGVDSSSVAIAMGKDHSPHLDLRVADFANPKALLECAGHFRLVTSINMLHCLVEDDHRVNFFENAFQLARQDGSLLLTTMCLPVVDGFKESKNPRSYRSVAEITAEAAAAGWDKVEWTDHQLPDESRRNKVSNLVLLARKS